MVTTWMPRIDPALELVGETSSGIAPAAAVTSGEIGGAVVLDEEHVEPRPPGVLALRSLAVGPPRQNPNLHHDLLPVQRFHRLHDRHGRRGGIAVVRTDEASRASPCPRTWWARLDTFTTCPSGRPLPMVPTRTTTLSP
jgi:hypothetical protein